MSEAAWFLVMPLLSHNEIWSFVMPARNLSKIERVCHFCGETFLTHYCKVAVGKGKFCSRDCDNASRRNPHRWLTRFLAHIHKSDESECHLWVGNKVGLGYGIVSCGPGVRKMAHRIAYELANGPILESQSHLFICHTCDNPSCVNPAHLFLGTPLDNMRDKMTKGRGSIGETHGNAKLTNSDIQEIRALRSSGWTLEDIGCKFGITASNVSGIARRKFWKHV